MSRTTTLLVSTIGVVVACSRAMDDSAGADRGGGVPARAELAAATCGARGNDCPLQGWMKANATPAMSTSDRRGLERAFERIATLDPNAREYPRWREIANAGSRASRSNDLEGARLACKECHDAYRERYRAERRAAPLR